MISKIEDYDIAFTLRDWSPGSKDQQFLILILNMGGSIYYFETKDKLKEFLSRNLSNINRDGIQFITDKIYYLLWYVCSQMLRSKNLDAPHNEKLIYEINRYIEFFNKINSISRDDSAKCTLGQIIMKHRLSDFQRDFYFKYYKM